MTRSASVPIPASTPASRTIGAAVIRANSVAAPAPARVASSGLSFAGRIQEPSQLGMERYVNFLISGGIVRSADMYAPMAMNAMWPKESTPELPLKIWRPRTMISVRNSRTAVSL